MSALRGEGGGFLEVSQVQEAEEVETLQNPTTAPRAGRLPPDAAMGPRLFRCVVFCLLGAGLMEAKVTQTPRHITTGTGQKLTVTCSQDMNHDYMYWYRQDPGLGLKLIYYSINVDSVENGDVHAGYVASRKKKANFLLTLESTNISQTSLYLCASSDYTALHSQLLSAQKEQPLKPGDISRRKPHPNQEGNLTSPAEPTDALLTPPLQAKQPLRSGQHPRASPALPSIPTHLQCSDGTS
uniref:Ig-like domain-containing protein n=1 Tax=Oryctolagus cuniculus TaxID=9986 RepID=A0A5F9D380_RABIT